MSALTEIYVDNVVRHLPENTRADIAAEITATIDDTVEARLGRAIPKPNPERTAAVEREVLEELGDPAVLSREYSNSPQHFIGPKSYPLFLWTLRWILPIVGLIAVLANVVVTVATTPDVQLGELIGSTVGNTVSALLTAFAVIAIIIGLGDRRADDAALPRMPGQQKGAWTIDDLDRRDVRGRQIRAEAALGLVFILALATIPFIPTSLLYVGHINHGGTFINPDLGTGWLLGYWGFLALLAVVEIIRFVEWLDATDRVDHRRDHRCGHGRLPHHRPAHPAGPPPRDHERSERRHPTDHHGRSDLDHHDLGPGEHVADVIAPSRADEDGSSPLTPGRSTRAAQLRRLEMTVNFLFRASCSLGPMMASRRSR